jgi:hypothetical protein
MITPFLHLQYFYTITEYISRVIENMELMHICYTGHQIISKISHSWLVFELGYSGQRYVLGTGLVTYGWVSFIILAALSCPAFENIWIADARDLRTS